MTLTLWLIAGAAVAAAIAFGAGYKLGHFHGRRRLGALLRQSGSVFADRL